MMKLGFKDTTQRIRDIVDWPPAQKGYRLETCHPRRRTGRIRYDGYKYCGKLVSFHKLAPYVRYCRPAGKRKIRYGLHPVREKVKTSISSKLLTDKKFILTVKALTIHQFMQNMFPLAFGIVPDHFIKSVVEFIKTRDGLQCVRSPVPS